MNLFRGQTYAPGDLIEVAGARVRLKVSPRARRVSLRIDHAKQLLTTSDLPIETIAREIGIDDAFYFSRLFQNREGLAPSAFRSRYRRQ